MAYFNALVKDISHVSDNGAAFTSAAFVDFMIKNGILHLTPGRESGADGQPRIAETITRGLNGKA